jgi:ribosomal protein S1
MRIETGDILTGTVLEIKEETAVINFDGYALEARVLTELEVNERVRVQVKGKYKKTIILKVLKHNYDGDIGDNSIDVKV